MFCILIVEYDIEISSCHGIVSSQALIAAFMEILDLGLDPGHAKL